MSCWNTEGNFGSFQFHPNISTFNLCTFLQRFHVKIETQFLNKHKVQYFLTIFSKNSVLPYSLISLSLTHFRLLVPLSHNVLKSGSDDGPLELLSPLGTFLGGFFLNTLPVLPSVEDGPCNLTWVPFQKMSTMASAVQKFEDLKQNFSSKHKNSTNVKFLDYLLCHLTWSRSYHG